MACGANLELGWMGLGRVTRTKDLEGEVHVEDVVEIPVTVLPLLDGDGMQSTLRDVLVGMGWTKQSDGTLTRSFGDVDATLSADAKTVTVRAKAKETITASATVQTVKGEEKKADAEAAKIAQKALDAKRVKTEEELARKNVETLTREERGVRAELQQALNRTYRKALEKRARQMGEVESLREHGDDRGSYEVTVVVRT